MIANEQLQAIVEGALLAATEPLTVKRLMSLFDEDEMPDNEAFDAALAAIAEACGGRGFELKQVASGWRLQVREELAPWINRLWEEKAQKYSRASLETLALIAYRQPITRGDIEEIRGVAVSSHIIRTLVEREWVKVVGQRDVPGRPSLYATTRGFLDYFNLKSLDELPTLSEIRDLDELNSELDLGEVLGASITAEDADDLVDENEIDSEDKALADLDAEDDFAASAFESSDSDLNESSLSDFESNELDASTAEQEIVQNDDLSRDLENNDDSNQEFAQTLMPQADAAIIDESDDDLADVNQQQVGDDETSDSVHTDFTDTQERDH
ncbi:SMC-Scp complex subunit ScpB [Gilvimarinus polysaccharolyticus]|uniref:SMC-Scp complex subunit ScpB n=1 Tax=Gilvimarinus polysaccharolyticus TaxID=863921 RepID=UPI000A03F296|nr:SMC-Scp complex subunit ScpB [Gilvimarinus polysaccharolyticus]